MLEVNMDPVHCRDESFKLGWVSGFYGCPVGFSSASIPETAHHSLFEKGYDAGLIAREQHTVDLGILRCMVDQIEHRQAA